MPRVQSPEVFMMMPPLFQRISNGYRSLLRKLVFLLAVLAGAGIVLMMATTCVDVVLRAFGHPIPGSYDIVGMLGVITISCALPYTTAVKGHVAVEYFFHKLSHRGRVVLDSIIRVVIIALFALLTWQSVVYSMRLYGTGEVTPTLQMPIFWVPVVIAFACLVTMLVVLHNLLHPGKVMIRP